MFKALITTMFLLTLSLTVFSGCGSSVETFTEPVTATLNDDDTLQTVRIDVNHGYAPNHIIAKAGVPLEMVFARDEKPSSCAAKLEIPAADIKETLINHRDTVVTVPADVAKAGEIPFHCSMEMMTGKIVFEGDSVEPDVTPSEETAS